MAQEAEEIEPIESVADSVMAAIKELDKPEEGIDTEGKIEEPVEEVAEEKAEEVPEAQEAAETDDPPEEEEKVEPKAPENWDKDRIAAFDSLENDESKQAFVDTFKSLEKGYNTKFEALAGERKEHEAIVNLMQPFEATLQAQGLDRLGGIRSLVGAQQMLTQDPMKGLTHLLQTYGGNNAKAIVETWAKQLGITKAAEGDAYVDQDIAALRDEINILSNNFQQTQTNAQQQQNTEAQNQVNLFEKATDSDGNVLHPHFEQVRATMGTLITSGLAPTMDDAYNMAIRTDATLHSEIMKVEREQEASNSNKERKEAVEASKKASKNVKTNNVAPDDKDKPEPDKVMDSVKKAMAEAG